MDLASKFSGFHFAEIMQHCMNHGELEYFKEFCFYLSRDNAEASSSFLYPVVIETADSKLYDLFVQKTFMNFFLKEQDTTADQIIEEDLLYIFSVENGIVMNIRREEKIDKTDG